GRSLDRLWERVLGLLGAESRIPVPSGTSTDDEPRGEEEEAEGLGLWEDADPSVPGPRWASAAAGLAAGRASAAVACPRAGAPRREVVARERLVGGAMGGRMSGGWSSLGAAPKQSGGSARQSAGPAGGSGPGEEGGK